MNLPYKFLFQVVKSDDKHVVELMEKWMIRNFCHIRDLNIQELKQNTWKICQKHDRSTGHKTKNHRNQYNCAYLLLHFHMCASQTAHLTFNISGNCIFTAIIWNMLLGCLLDVWTTKSRITRLQLWISMLFETQMWHLIIRIGYYKLNSYFLSVKILIIQSIVNWNMSTSHIFINYHRRQQISNQFVDIPTN